MINFCCGINSQQIETHPYPTKYYYDGDAFIEEISKNNIEIALPMTNK